MNQSGQKDTAALKEGASRNKVQSEAKKTG
jgi:hypothetical protein